MCSFKMISKGVFPVLVLMAVGAHAQDKTIVPERKDTVVVKKPAIKTVKEFFTGKVESRNGMFTVYKTEDKYYFEIPDSLLGREILVTTRLSAVPSGAPKFPGEIVNSKTIAFFKGPSNNLFVKVMTHGNLVQDGDAIATAVKNASENPIVSVFDVKAAGNGGKGYLIDVTDYFRNDNPIVGFSSESRQKMQLGGVAADRSFIESMHAFPINIEVKSLKTFSAGAAGPKGAEGEGAPAEAMPDAGALTVGTVTSLMLMPKDPMTPRNADPRIGYFSEDFNKFSDAQQKVENISYIVRFRMEPKDEDIEKYKKGELVEPKKPIVFYTDPAIPKQWRPYIIAGINAWQAAFEKAGFKNAIVGKEWPENDTTMSLEDARYFVIRYMPSYEKNAQGVQVHDPRSGEILQAYVGWHMSIMRLLHDWYMMQAGAVDPKARKMKFDDELMGRLIQYSVTHEIGHTLGLEHNMGASSTVPVEKLRDAKWLAANGHTPSVMDYARFNYVAQPEDHVGEDGIIPRIGAYDKWAIEWGYKYLGFKNAEDEKKVTEKWLTDSLKADHSLWFAGDTKNNDPRTQAEDLGDNDVKSAEYGIKNLKRVAANLEAWSKEPNDTYSNLEDMYDKLGAQYQQYMFQVVANIGGVYENVTAPGQVAPVYTIVPKSIQKSAVAFMNREFFQTPQWALNKDMLNKFRRPGKEEWMQKIQEAALNYVLSISKLHQLDVNERRFGSEQAYSLEEMLTDVENGVFSELTTHKTPDMYRRSLQKQYVSFLDRIIKLQGKVTDPKPGIPDYSSEDLLAVLREHLAGLQKSVKAAVPFATDPLCKAHLQYLNDEIGNILTNR